MHDLVPASKFIFHLEDNAVVRDLGQTLRSWGQEELRRLCRAQFVLQRVLVFKQLVLVQVDDVEGIAGLVEVVVGTAAEAEPEDVVGVSFVTGQAPGMSRDDDDHLLTNYVHFGNDLVIGKLDVGNCSFFMM